RPAAGFRPAQPGHGRVRGALRGTRADRARGGSGRTRAGRLHLLPGRRAAHLQRAGTGDAGGHAERVRMTARGYWPATAAASLVSDVSPGGLIVGQVMLPGSLPLTR